jgi:hypothetical protein
MGQPTNVDSLGASELSTEPVNRRIISQLYSSEGQAQIAELNRKCEEIEFGCVGDEATRKRLKEELRRVQRAIHDPATAPDHCRFYHVAQQSLAWCGNPELFASPTKTIESGSVFQPSVSIAAV